MFDFDFKDGGAEDVAGAVVGDFDFIVELVGLVVAYSSEFWDDFVDVFGGVEWFNFARTFSIFLTVSFLFVFSVFFLNLGGVAHDDFSEFEGWGCGVDGAIKTIGDKFGDEAAVVKVSVGKEDEIDGGRFDFGGVPVAFNECAFLEHAAID